MTDTAVLLAVLLAVFYAVFFAVLMEVIFGTISTLSSHKSGLSRRSWSAPRISDHVKWDYATRCPGGHCGTAESISCGADREDPA